MKAKWLGLVAMCGALLWAGRAWAKPNIDIEVDFAEIVGEFRPLSGMQGSPYPVAEGDVEQVESFREFGIQLCRFPQDCLPNTLTLSGIFPDAKADPAVESSYHFEEVDKHIRSAKAAGCRILWQSSYDVGGTDSWKGVNLGGRAPQDLELWGQVVDRCLEHFNHNWKNGFHHSVEFVEFVNEPDGLGGFEGPERERMFPAFLHFLSVIEAYNQRHPDFPVLAVGPGIPMSWDRADIWKPALRKRLSELRDSGKDLPVFSFHTYGEDISPQGNRKLALALRAELDAHGFEKTRLMNSEWQGGDYLKAVLGLTPGKVYTPTPQQAALYRQALATYALSCKIAWQGVLDESCYYLAKRRVFPSHVETAGLDLGICFPPQGPANDLAKQEKLLATFAEHTPLRVFVTEVYEQNVFALALRSKDDSYRVLLLCNLNIESRHCKVRMAGSNTGKGWVRALGSDEKTPFSETIELPGMSTSWVEWKS